MIYGRGSNLIKEVRLFFPRLLEDEGARIGAMDRIGMDRHAPAPGNIHSIVVRRHPDWSDYHRNTAPRTYHEAQVSLPRGISCHTTITLASGTAHVSQVDYPKGSIENLMSDDELRTKFESLAVPVVGASRAAEIADAVICIERCANVGELMRLTAAPSRKPPSARSRRSRRPGSGNTGRTGSA